MFVNYNLSAKSPSRSRVSMTSLNFEADDVSAPNDAFAASPASPRHDAKGAGEGAQEGAQGREEEQEEQGEQDGEPDEEQEDAGSGFVLWVVSGAEVMGREKSLLLQRPNSLDSPTDSGNQAPGQHCGKHRGRKKQKTADRIGRGAAREKNIYARRSFCLMRSWA